MMFRTLRGRLVLSHALPLLVIVPLMGIALVYVLETQLLLQSLSGDLLEQAQLVAEIARDNEGIWEDATQAQSFLARFAGQTTADILLISPSGVLLASSKADDVSRLGLAVELDYLEALLAGHTSQRTHYSRQLHAQVVEVAVPVADPGQGVIGAVHLSHQLASISERFVRLRSWIAGVLVGGLALGAAIGWALAVNLERPLRGVTEAVANLAGGGRSPPVAETGPQELRLLARSVNTLVARLTSLEEARRQLLANLVHELGRPLGALRSAIQALRGGADQQPDLRDELLEGMDSEVGRLHRLVDDLAGLHGQVLGTLELHREPTEVGDWLAHLLAPWRQAARAKGVHWQESLLAQLPTLEIDPDRTAQALGNLLSNAVKFTPAGGTVSVGAGVEGELCWIRVADTGPGIPLEEQRRIFEPFYRSGAGPRFPQGMGLGLSIARDLVGAHGGYLDLDSVPGQGSRFTIWLPLSTP
jgi:two-component system sensor histidine kinase BaeS